MPLRAPLRSAHGTEAIRDVVLVRVVDDDGVTGWGECSALAAPTYTGEYADGAWDVLTRFVVPAVLAGRAPQVREHPMALAAVAGAQADAAARRAGRSLAAVLGGVRSSVASCAVVGLAPQGAGAGDGPVGDVVAAVAEALEAGHRQVKVKVRPGWSLEPVRAVRAGWPDLALAVDANGSFDPAAPGELDALDGLGLAYVEQPFAPDALVATAALARRWSTPVALDESITSPGWAEAAFALGAAGAVNLKPARVGGLAPAVAVASAAAARGIPVFVGGMLETGVGRAHALAVASLAACTWPSDLGPSTRYFAEDLAAPFHLRDGALVVPEGPGVGVVPDADRLDQVAVARTVLDR